MASVVPIINHRVDCTFSTAGHASHALTDITNAAAAAGLPPTVYAAKNPTNVIKWVPPCAPLLYRTRHALLVADAISSTN